MKSRAQKVLADILETGIDVHRCGAARAFATIGGDDAVAVLIAALLDEDPDVRTDAAQSLWAIGDPAAATQLMENLVGDPEPDVKKAALEALISFRHDPVVPLLRKLAISRTKEVFWDEDEFYSEGWDSWLDMQLIAIRGLAVFAPEDAVQDVLAAMGDEQGQDVSEAGVAALAGMGADGAIALEQLFPLSDTRLQRRIADVVMRSKNPHVTAQIDVFLGDKTPAIRQIAARGLERSDPRLEPLLDDPDAEVRAIAVRQAGRDYPNKIKEMIADPGPSVRVEVFKVIAQSPETYRDKDLIKAVKKAISGEARAAKQAALALIALEGADAIKGLTHVMTNKKVPLDFRVGAVEALEKAGPVSAPHLLKAAADDERQLRLAAMTALAGLAANDPVWPNLAGEGLIGALNGTLIVPPEEVEPTGEPPEADVTEIAPDPDEPEPEIDESTPLVAVPDAPEGSTLASILAASSAPPETAQTEDKEVPEPIVPDARMLELAKQHKMSKRKMSLESDVAPYLDVRRFAAAVLGGVPNRDVTDQLISVLGDDDKDLAHDALNSLVQHGDTVGTLPVAAQEPLLELYGLTATDSLRVLALRALSKLGDAAVPTLREALNDPDPHIRVEAVRGLDDNGIADASIKAALQDGYIGVGIAAAKSLARHQGAGALEALIEFAFLNDGTHRREVGQMLGLYAPQEALNRLIELASDDTRLRQRLVVIDALAEVIATTDQSRELNAA